MYQRMSDCFANQFRNEAEAREWVNNIERFCSKIEMEDYLLVLYPNDLKSLLPIILLTYADEVTVYCPLPDGFEADFGMQNIKLIPSEELKITYWWD